MHLLSNEPLLTFDDISLVPAEFSSIRSRSEVNTESKIGSTVLKLPIISSNMTSVFTPDLANKLQELGGKSIIHRFCTVEENLRLLKASSLHGIPWVSVGASISEMDRAEALVDAGAEVLVLDMAMGNSIVAVEQYNRLVEKYPNIDIIVSDFSLMNQINAFLSKTSKSPAAFMIGQGCGSACKTREVTGMGIPVVTALNSCMSSGQTLILNGGIRTSGDFAKTLAIGAKAVVIGRLFAQTQESFPVSDPKFNYFENQVSGIRENAKTYSGSASNQSYIQQGKSSKFRAPEGESFQVKINNTVEGLYNEMNGGLRSSMSYLNSNNLEEYARDAKFVKVTNAGSKEASAFGRNS